MVPLLIRAVFILYISLRMDSVSPVTILVPPYVHAVHVIPQSACACSKLTKETLGKGVKYAQS